MHMPTARDRAALTFGRVWPILPDVVQSGPIVCSMLAKFGFGRLWRMCGQFDQLRRSGHASCFLNLGNIGPKLTQAGQLPLHAVNIGQNTARFEKHVMFVVFFLFFFLHLLLLFVRRFFLVPIAV